MDHRDSAIIKKPRGFEGCSFLIKSFLVPVPIEIGVSAASEACRFLLSEKSQSGGVRD